MLIKQVFNIGDISIQGKREIDILLGLQNPVRPRDKDEKAQVMTLLVDLSKSGKTEYAYELIEYNEEMLSKYLLGLSSGNGANYSLSLTTGWKHEPELSESKRADKIDKFFDKILAIRKNANLVKFFKEQENLWIPLLLEDIEKGKVTLFDQFESYLLGKGTKNFTYPLILKIKKPEEPEYKFLGEIKEMVEMYPLLFFQKVDPESKIMDCSICGSSRNLTQSFTMGMYSTTQIGFVMHFFSRNSDFSGQNVMCVNCFLKTMLGFNIIQEKLNFYAYSLKNGATSDAVMHFIIPLANDKKLLKKSIELIGQAKKSHDAAKQSSITSQIAGINSKLIEISTKIKKANKQQEKELKKEAKALETERKAREEALGTQDNRLDTEYLVDTLKDQPDTVSVLDLYYKITNQKQNPKTIAVVSDILLNAGMIKTLATLFSKTKAKFGTVRLSSLQEIVEDRFFLEYYSSILSLTPQSKVVFDARCVERVKKYFLSDFLGYSYYELNKKLHAFNVLDIYERYVYMFGEVGLWRP